MSDRRVLYVQFTNPAGYPPLQHSAELFAEHGCDVHLLGINLTTLRLPAHPRITVRLLDVKPNGWRQKLAYLRFLVAVGWYVLRLRPTCVYASDALAAPAGLLAKALGARVIYHEHDTPAETTAPAGASWFMRQVLAARLALGKRADLCVLPNAKRASAFASAVGRSDVLVVWNCPRRNEAERSKSPSTGNGLRLVFHGSIVPARQLDRVIEALADLPPDVSLTIIGYETVGHPGYVAALTDKARSSGVADRVAMAGPISRGELLKTVATCDVGLALFPMHAEHSDEADMVGASNKPFEYLACGLPILISDVPQWREAFAAPGLGLTCRPDSIASVSDAIRFLRNHAVERREMGERGRQRIAESWNYEAQFAPVLRAVLGT